MATMSRRARTETIIEFVVPTPSTWAEVDKAAAAAWAEFAEHHGRNPADDELWVRPGDDAIVISFKREQR